MTAIKCVAGGITGWAIALPIVILLAPRLLQPVTFYQCVWIAALIGGTLGAVFYRYAIKLMGVIGVFARW